MFVCSRCLKPATVIINVHHTRETIDDYEHNHHMYRCDACTREEERYFAEDADFDYITDITPLDANAGPDRNNYDDVKYMIGIYGQFMNRIEGKMRKATSDAARAYFTAARDKFAAKRAALDARLDLLHELAEAHEHLHWMNVNLDEQTDMGNGSGIAHYEQSVRESEAAIAKIEAILAA